MSRIKAFHLRIAALAPSRWVQLDFDIRPSPWISMNYSNIRRYR